jgi:hypothetical protein
MYAYQCICMSDPLNGHGSEQRVVVEGGFVEWMCACVRACAEVITNYVNCVQVYMLFLLWLF